MSDGEDEAEKVFAEEAGKGSTAPAVRRRRAAAFSYSLARSVPSSAVKVRLVRSVEGDAVCNGTGGGSAGDSGGGCSSSSGEGDASDSIEKLEYTFVDEIPSECLCGLCGGVSHALVSPLTFIWWLSSEASGTVDSECSCSSQ